MADQSVPTLTIVTDLRGGNNIHVDATSIVVDESKGDFSRLSLNTFTASPAWYVDVSFPVNSITVNVLADRIFTGYVTSWRRARPSGDWIIEAADVLYVAEKEWLVPTRMDTMLEYSGLVSDFVSGLLSTTCGYASVSIADIPYTLGPQEPFEYGFESVKALIDRLGAILQTELWADENGGVHWGWASDFPNDDFGQTCSVEDATQGGVFYYNRNRGSVWADIGSACGAYLAAMNSEYATYNTNELLLAEHRQHRLPGETASHPTRGNLLSWEQTDDEDTYRVGAIVFGLPPIRAEHDKGAFPYADLADLNNVAIVSSALIQEQWIAEDVARNLSEQSAVKRTAAWEAIGNTKFHVNVTHFVDTLEFFGYGRVLSVTHTVNDSGYTIRGESRIGDGYRRGLNDSIMAYDEHILAADVSGGVERYEGTWEMPVSYNAATGLWTNDAAQFTYTHAWSDISSAAWTSDIHEVAWVHAPGWYPHPVSGLNAAVEGYALAINNQGIWRNYWVGDWTLSLAQIRAEWELIMTPAEWSTAASAGYDAGLVTCIEESGSNSRWPDRTFTPEMTHFMIHEPDFMLETGIIRFGVLASGSQYYGGVIGGWIGSSHIFLFTATLASGNLTNLQCIGALHSTGGAYAPWAGWWNWSAWSYTDANGTALIWARPLNYAFGAICYSMEALVVAVSAALTSHGGTWYDSPQRFNHLVDARWGLCATSGNSVRGYVAQRINLAGGVSTIDVPTIGGGGLLDWRGVALWGGIEYGNIIALQGVIEDTEFGRWIENWEGNVYVPFIVNWYEPWALMTYLITTDGVVHRMSRLFETPRAPGDYKTPEAELWDTIFDNLGPVVFDGDWNQILDWGGSNFSVECPYLINPYTAAYYVDGQRFLPISAAGGQPVAITKRGSTVYNFTACGKGRKRITMLYEDGTTCCALQPRPPASKKAEDEQCCATKPLTVTDGDSATDIETSGAATVRF